MDTGQEKASAGSTLASVGFAVVLMGVGLGGGIGIGNLISPAAALTHGPEHATADMAHAEPAAESVAPFATEIELAKPGDPMPVSMLTSDCLACHQATFKVVGPAYQQVADKYQGQPNQVRKLARKVILGGTGVWGQIPMTPHPQHSFEDAQEMVAWILGQTTTPPADPAFVQEPGGK